MSFVTTRFAPSPTGFLHIGNARTALVTWLYARANNGKFILRIDDTDLERSKPEYTEAIKEDLAWLGLDWDLEIHQSHRFNIYKSAQEKLLKLGRLYSCYETQEELEIKKKILLSKNFAPIYDRAALRLTDTQKQELEMQGHAPYWRFLMEHGEIKWYDKIKGELHFQASKISDPVLIRADGRMTYSLASVVDDIELNITDIIRGEDHVSNSAMHIQMFEALEGNIPNFAHLSLVQGKNREISKRLGGFEIRALRERGIKPMAINSFLATIGTSNPAELRTNINQLFENFTLNKFSKSPVTYDESDIERLNLKLIHHLPYHEVQGDVSTEINEEFWETVKPNLNTISEIEDWHKICRQPLVPVITDINLTTLAANLLPQLPWDEDTWNIWINFIKEKSNKRGKELFLPIRLALTAMETGPELKNILPFIGYQKVYERLNGKTS